MTNQAPPSSVPDRAVLLLSGGMDSTTLLWWMKKEGVRHVHTVSIDYGQRHAVELASSERLSSLGRADVHRVLRVDLTQIGGSPLTNGGIDVPSASEARQIVTVVPYRNLLFVAVAAAYAETEGISNLFISPVQDDYAAYRDCRREFYDAVETALSLGATRDTQVRTHTPFITWPKSDVIKLGLDLGVPYAETHTCYAGTRPACGVCDACAERIAAFRENGVPDPIDYEIPIDWPGEEQGSA